MARPMGEVIAEQAEVWSGIKVPNEAGAAMAEALQATADGFARLRGALVFEEEPASFEAVLREFKE
jgi:hypothetical protein